MATQEKLLKSLESLQQLITSKSENLSKKKEKIQHCHFLTDAITSSTIKIAPNFNQLVGFTFETLLELCDDSEADIRIIADESLNKIIRGLSDGNVGKVQIELHKEIKKNGTARSLKAALWRFANLAELIRPHKGKPYVVNLIPCIIKITEREEEFIHDTLTSSLPKILKVLGSFTNDNDIKALLKAFLKNIPHTSTVIRRNAAQCLLITCLNCRKPYYFLIHTLNNLLDMLIPIDQEGDNSLRLGVMGAIKVLLPSIKSNEANCDMLISFGSKKEITDVSISLDRLLQTYELCLHYLTYSDHNVVNVALETLNVLLHNCQNELKVALLSPDGINQSRIMISDPNVEKDSLYEMSIASSRNSEENLLDSLVDPLRTDIEKWIDQSKLSVININYVSDTLSTTDSVSVTGGNLDGVDPSVLGGVSLKEAPEQIDNFRKTDEYFEQQLASENASEYSCLAEETGSITTLTDLISQEFDIGQFKDGNTSLIYCTRLITKSFLLCGKPKGLIPDRHVRVSVKNLALTCLSSVFQLFPDALLLSLDKNVNHDQPISDVLLFENHHDPQLRGIVRVLVASFLRAVFVQSNGCYDDWLRERNVDNDIFNIGRMVEVFVKGMENDSSTCVRQSLSSLTLCLKQILYSHSCQHVLPILNVLPTLAKKPYWLVKVRLIEIVTNIDYIAVEFVTRNSDFQNKVIYNVLLELLKEEDQRVRNAASNAIVNIIPLLYFQQHTPNQSPTINRAIQYKNLYISLNKLGMDVNVTRKNFLHNMPSPFNSSADIEDKNVEFGLSRIILKLHQILLNSTSKHVLYGCLETLSALSYRFPCTIYKTSWNCFKNCNFQLEKSIFQRSNSIIGSISTICEANVNSSKDLLNISINLLSHVIVYDLNCHTNLLRFSGNIFAGKCLENLQLLSDINVDSIRLLWDMFSDKVLQDLSESFLNHVVKLLNIFAHVIEENTPILIQPKPVLGNLPPASVLSPLKRRKSDLDRSKLAPGRIEKEERSDKKSESAKATAMGYFANVPHYMKIYDILKTAYLNYKVTLESSASENFLKLLKTSLLSLCQILEVATLAESGRIAEEVLGYLRTTFVLDPTSTVDCVHQLLKSLFGTNLTLNVDTLNFTSKVEEDKSEYEGFYFNLFQQPYTEIACFVHGLNQSPKIECDSDYVVMGYLHRKEIKKPCPSSDKILANYIRIFEPMVIKSLKQYTITSNVKLQSKVLQLLSQLVQLRVNYCLLDSEQIFIGFVLKQFEFIEEAQISYPEELIPKIFQFLVHLSYGKHHSKSIIGVPKIIQLCDGLMASGQDPLTYCIPALEPIVEDIFLVRNKSNTVDFNELETTREVLLSMLLRLVEHRQIIDLIVLILNESKYCDNADKWQKWSKQVFDVFLTVLRHNKIRLDDANAMESVMRLLLVLNPSVYKPINEILITLFQRTPSHADSVQVFNRYVGKVIIIFLILTQTKEKILLSKMSECLKDFSPKSIFEKVVITPDPLNVINNLNYFDGIPPDEIFVKLIFRVFELASTKCLDFVDEDVFIAEQLSHFLIICSYIFQTGEYRKITNAATRLTNPNSENKNKILLKCINDNFMKLAAHRPSLTFQWCFVLTVLNYGEFGFWKTVINVDNSVKVETCLHSNIVQLGSSIAYCEYLTENIQQEDVKWFINKKISLLIGLCTEIPVKEFIATVHREPELSSLFLDALLKLSRNYEPSFLMKITKSVENIHTSQTGRLIQFLIREFLNCRQLALQRLISNQISRKVEYLLMLSTEEAKEQINRNKLIDIMDLFKDQTLAKKNEGLISILNKLSTQLYDLPPLELDQRRAVNPDLVKKLEINKAWYLSQIKAKCRGRTNGPEIAELLSKLDHDDVVEVIAGQDFNKHILRDIILLGSTFEERHMLVSAVEILLKSIRVIVDVFPKLHEVYQPSEKLLTEAEQKYSDDLAILFSDTNFWNNLQDLIPSLTIYIEVVKEIPENISSTIIQFCTHTLESIIFLITYDKLELNIHFIHRALECAEAAFKNNTLMKTLSTRGMCSWLCSSVNVIYRLVSFLLLDLHPLPSLPKNGLRSALENQTTISIGLACYQLFLLVAWIETIQGNDYEIPFSLFSSIKSIVISLARLPHVNSYVLTPPSAWKNGLNVELTGTFYTQVPPLPVEYMQEIEVLEEYIYRITLLGWRNRQQFEETWMSLLSVISSNASEMEIPEEANALANATSLSISAITSLLVLTMYDPNPGNGNNSKLFHVSRDSVIEENSASIKKLKIIQNKFFDKYHQDADHSREKHNIVNVFDKPNLEKHRSNYNVGQISLAYLLISAQIVEVSEDSQITNVNKRRQRILSECGLDLNSCIRFLLDLYSQWIREKNSAPLRIINEVIKSVLIISDLFLEKSQFEWMFQATLNLVKTHAAEDEILHQYLIVNLCKATAVLNPDMETYELVKRSLAQGLKSAFLAMRIGSLQGLLYILQGCILANTVIGGISEELQLFVPMVTEYVQCNVNTANNLLLRSQDHTLLLWSLAFYIIENIPEIHLPAAFVPNTIQTSIAMLNLQKQPNVIHNAVMKGLERLIVKKCLPEKLHEQTTQLALEKMKDNNPMHSLPAVQLLISCMYIECEDQLEDTEKSNGIVQTIPDNLVQTIEKVSAIFDKIKKGNPFEVKLLCSILPNILHDFFLPSDILTKVVGEFLSPQQNHPKLLSRVVFQVFESGIEQHQLSLLQDWVVFSLSNFTQSFSVGMSTWCLTCFFISASTSKWLRSFFPYVQSRIGRYEYEDKKMLCITGSDFYRNLTTDKQKQTFVDSFLKVKDQIDMPFSDLLASL